ncbi:Arogenate dehydratase/prephenate dehydratase 2, chloroplastic [Sesamum angolense]|uniref:Arogenate dehydratase n=1 Tax=Sesamum angolense TaxID=2727404 RepID=A0AAE2C4L4_9LAMI|nr:Arogenate dehydratase/prephenate dehydratase 2, chloroplastic [Sesamum angolense]
MMFEIYLQNLHLPLVYASHASARSHAPSTMAATTSRSPLAPLYSQIQNPKTNPFFTLKLPNISRHACSSTRSSRRKIQAIELQKIIEDYPYEFNSKDSPTSLPRPLTSAQLSNLTSEGSRLRVAYQGVRGAYSESAAEKAYPNCEAVPCEQFDTAFEMNVGISYEDKMSDETSNVVGNLAVERWLVDRAVLPIENSLGGSIHRNYDLLLRHRLHIVGEVKLAIRHCLLANNDIKVEDLKRVLSHPQALAQCENTLTQLGLVREAVDDTAGAAKHVALHKLKDAGAVASMTAAKIYGLIVLAEDIQDDSDNVTRFLMLARSPSYLALINLSRQVCLSLEEGPGMLFKALAVFAMRNINLTKIESRPLPKRALQTPDENATGFPNGILLIKHIFCYLAILYFPYLFYVDFEASMADERAQNALGHLKEFATFMRVLGSYPADNGLP